METKPSECVPVRQLQNQNKEGGKMKQLRKSQENRKICGVCGGLAEYANIDPTVVRLLWVLFSCVGGSGVLAYIVAAIIMPE